MEYIWGALAGLAFGGLIGLIKYYFLWHRAAKLPETGEITSSYVYIRMIASNIINIAVLATVFLLRDIMSFSFVAALFGAAVGLSIAGKLAPVRKIIQHIREERQIYDSKTQ